MKVSKTVGPAEDLSGGEVGGGGDAWCWETWPEHAV